MKAFVLLPLYIAVAVLPLIFSAAFGGAPRPFREELASGLGIFAFSIILSEFVLSGRFKSVSRDIGMDVTMRFHQLMARTALVCAVVHPFLYRGTPTGGPRPWDSTRQLSVATDFSSLAPGIVAFLLLPPLVLLAIWRSQLDVRYETWRLMHGIGALAIACLVLLHAITAGRYSAEPAIGWLWGAMTAAAIGSLLYVYVLVPIKTRKRKWRITSVVRLSQRQWEVTAAPDGHPGLAYRAGQFAWLNIGHSPFSVYENPFSFSSAPSQGPEVSFVIKELGDFTRSLRDIRPGTCAFLDGPFGSLGVDRRSEPGVVLIGGGVGIAPLLSILRELRTTKDPRGVLVIYGNRSEEQILYPEELTHERAVLTLSEPPDGWEGETGMIDEGLLERVLTGEQIRSWLFVLCGPPVMMDRAEDWLIERGVPSSRILSERFGYA